MRTERQKLVVRCAKIGFVIGASSVLLIETIIVIIATFIIA